MMRNGIFAPEPAKQRHSFVEPCGAFFALDTERLVLGTVCNTQPESGE